jgi:hypothetical protein
MKDEAWTLEPPSTGGFERPVADASSRVQPRWCVDPELTGGETSQAKASAPRK